MVDLYALTNPQHTPWRVPSRVLYQDVPCRNCYRSVCPENHHACLAGVEPERVIEAALELAKECGGRSTEADARAAVAPHALGRGPLPSIAEGVR